MTNQTINCDMCKNRMFGPAYVTNDHDPCGKHRATRIKWASDCEHNPYADNHVSPVSAVICADYQRIL